MNRVHLLPIIAVLCVSTAPHLGRLPLWVSLTCICSWFYLLYGLNRHIPLPGKKTLAFLTVLLVLLNVLTFGRIFGRDAGVSMLALMLALKPFEISTARDRLITILLALFLIIFNLFYSESFSMAVYMVFAALAVLAVLNHLHHPLPRQGLGLESLAVQIRPSLRTAGVIMLQALPVLLVLFLLFPRMPAGLGVRDASRKYSGLKDTLELGGLSRMALSRDPAFRAEFNGPAPPRSLLYWRGFTLWRFDSAAWIRGDSLPETDRPLLGKGPAEYSIILEPHGETWLYTLDMPGNTPVYGPDRRSPRGRYIPPARAAMLADRTLQLPKELKKKLQYDMTSFMQYNTGEPEVHLERGLELPSRINPRSRKLARQWRAEEQAANKIAARGLEYITNNPFYYTLDAPEVSGLNRIDQFLFETRKGFCEHYAAAYCFLMRAAGVPCRIVMGYQGGEYNEVGDYYMVRAMEAHAWNEVYLQGQGWVRVDPTAAVAPERVEQNMMSALDEYPFTGGLSMVELERRFPPLIKARQTWDAVNYAWNRWVLDYTYEKQKKLLSRFGLDIDSWKGMLKTVGAMLGSMLLLAGVVYLFLRRSGAARQQDRVRRLYDRFCRKLANAGVVRRPDQGPEDFALQAAQLRPDLADEIWDISRRYAALRYGKAAREGGVKELDERVRRFKT